MVKRIISLVTLALCLLSMMLITVPVSANSISIHMENGAYGTVNGNTIELIPQGLTVEKFLGNIQGAYGINLEKEMYDPAGNAISEGSITDNMKVRITSGTSVDEYTLKLAPVLTMSDFVANDPNSLIYPRVNTKAEGIPVSGVICVEGRITMTAYENITTSIGMQDGSWTYPFRFYADGTIGQFYDNSVRIPYELNKPYQIVVLMDLPKKRSWLYINGILMSMDKNQGDSNDRMWDGKLINNIYISKRFDYFKYYSVSSVEEFDIAQYSCDLIPTNLNLNIDKETGIIQVMDDTIATKKDLFGSLQFANEEDKLRFVLRNRIGAAITNDATPLRNTMYLEVTSPNGLATMQYAINGVSDPGSDSFTQGDYDKLGLLKALGVFGTEDTLSTANVSRGEFAAYLVSMTNSLGLASSWTVPFTDVDAENLWAPYIYAAAAQGFMSGRGNGTFGTGDRITSNEAITALVRVAGYEQLAKAKGGYPSGYYAAARSAGLLSGVQDDGSRPVSELEAITLLYNTLMAPYNSISLYSNEQIQYTAYKDVTVLEQFHKLKKAKGRVTGNSLTHIYEAGKNTAPGQLLIDEVPYAIPVNSGYESYLGMEVEFYYAEAGIGQYSVVYMNRLNGVGTLTLQADSIASVSGNALSYFDKEGNVKKCTLASGYSFLYNGRIDTGRTSNDLLIPDGELTLIDGSGSGRYDTVMAKVPELFLFEGSSESTGTIYATGAVLETNVDSASIKLVDKLGTATPITIKEIPYPSVLTVYRSKDKKCIEVYASTTTREDTLTEKSEDALVVGGSRLTMAPNFDASELIFNETYLFRLDALGRIAFYEVSQAAGRYGYLIGVAGAKGLGGKPQLRIVTGASEYVDYTVAEKVMLNDKQQNSAEALYSGALEPQLIKYIVNKNNEVTGITTNLVGESISGRYISSGGVATFSGSIVLTGTTFTLEVPTLAEEVTNYQLYNAPTFQNEQTYSITVYDLDEASRSAGAIILYATGSLTGSANLEMNISMGIVKRLTSTADQKGNALYALELVGRSGTFKYYLSEERFSDMPDLKFGDCIRYMLNSQGDTILNLAREFRVDRDGTNYSVTPNTTLTSYSLRYGTIQNKYDKYITMNDIQNGISCVLPVTAGVSFRVDFKNETITPTTIADMLPNVTGVYSRGSSTYPPSIIVEYMFDN